MSEDNTAIDTGDQQTTADPFITKASAAGWRPLEEFEGDPEQWVDAKEFVKRAPLYEKNHKLKKELAEVKTTLHEVKGYISKVAESSYKKAVADLMAQRDEAIDQGDRTQVREIDRQIKEAESIKVQDNSVHPAIKEWEDANGAWFYADKEISLFGMAYAEGHLKNNPGDFAGAIELMDKALKKAFPEKFENPKRKDPPAVETGGRGTVKKSYTEADLDEESRKVMNRFVRQGVMTKEDYIKGLVESGALGGRK